MKKVLFICVNYNNYEETLEYINCVNSLDDCNFCDIVAVDNSTDKNQISSLKDNNLNEENVYIVKSNKNLGYFGGMNLGINYYLSLQKEIPHWVIISNTDIKFDNKKFIADLCNLKKNKNIVCIAPKIISVLTKKNQNPYMKNRPSVNKLSFLKTVYRSNITFSTYNYLYNIKESMKIKNNNAGEDKDFKNIYAPHGSFIILDNLFFQKGGTLKYNGFLYGEEIYLGEQICNMGLEIQYNGNFVLHHNEHKTTALLNTSVNRMYRYNAIKYLKEMMFKKDTQYK